LAVRIFYGVLDQAAVNSFVLYTLNANNQMIMRERFLLELSMALIKPFLIKRLSHSTLFNIFYFCSFQHFLSYIASNNFLSYIASNKFENKIFFEHL